MILEHRYNHIPGIVEVDLLGILKKAGCDKISGDISGIIHFLNTIVTERTDVNKSVLAVQYIKWRSNRRIITQECSGSREPCNRIGRSTVTASGVGYPHFIIHHIQTPKVIQSARN